MKWIWNVKINDLNIDYSNFNNTEFDQLFFHNTYQFYGLFEKLCYLRSKISPQVNFDSHSLNCIKQNYTKL